ncbi:sensor histidine kinase [Pseudonocardia sp. TRM90224]|uniref:sensor histidine kinase n=1 Tax=Pseudonocardia sp. TRM90224 TaxID=2812678 RepID=UPI001E2A1BE6|nr:histidine kinase [Pseudonocardia sp. TRM90224]
MGQTAGVDRLGGLNAADEGGLPEPGLVRVGVTVLAAGVGVLALTTDPGTAADAAWALVAVVLLPLWVWLPQLPLRLVVVAVLVAAVLATRGGDVEPTLFLVSTAAVLVGWFEWSTAWSVGLVVLAALCPLVVRVLMPPEGFSQWIWVLGIVFPWLLGVLARQQFALAHRLQDARAELAEQAVAGERQRIARDVHDLVGHGLAAVLLQITSARHVLRRDPDAADEALAAAETAGRSSMAELRRTMALLRDEPGGPAADLDGIAEVVRSVREQGLRVRYERSGEAPVPDGVGIAVHRIAQEALANAVRHAPDAETAVVLTAEDGAVKLTVTSLGPLRVRERDERPRYGLVGMRERAEVAGGELSAGPVAGGWEVRCRVPLT